MVVVVLASGSGLEAKSLLEEVNERAGIHGTTSKGLVVDSDGFGRGNVGSKGW